MKAHKLLYSMAETEAGIAELAQQIHRHFSADSNEFALVGIHQMGVPLAQRLCSALEEKGRRPDFGQLDITMYRDDIGSRSLLPLIEETVIPFDINGKEIILVDDVLSSGRTIRAALDAITDFGRPKLIRLAVLVDRGDPEFPIRADFTAFHIQLPAQKKVLVRFTADVDYPAGVLEIDWKKQEPTF